MSIFALFLFFLWQRPTIGSLLNIASDSAPTLNGSLYATYGLNPEFHWLCQIATTLHEFHWPFWIIFLDANAKAKKLIRESIAQNLKQVSLTKSFLALAMAFNLLLSNLTLIAKAQKPLCQWNWQGYFFQLATKICELEPRLKVAKKFCQWLRGDRLGSMQLSRPNGDTIGDSMNSVVLSAPIYCDTQFESQAKHLCFLLFQ